MNEKLSSEQIQLVAFTIILHSGNAKMKTHEAFKAMRNANFVLAHELLEAANDELLEAHKSQTELLQSYANGKKIEMEIIMVHAQDHLMTAMTLHEIASEMSHLYSLNHELRQTVKL